MNVVNHFAFKNPISQAYQNIPFAQIGQRLDYVGRGIGHTFCIIEYCAIGSYFLVTASKETVVSCAAGGTLFLVFAVVTKIHVEKIFNLMNIQPSLQRKTVERSIAGVSAVLLSSAALVGFGLAPSLSHIFYKVFPLAFTLALNRGVASAIQECAHNIFNNLGIPQSQRQRDPAAMLISELSAIVLAPSIAVGFRLYPSPFDFIPDIINFLFLACIPVMFGAASIGIYDLIVDGPMTWTEIGRNLRFG